MNYKLSIIIPVYNVERYLYNCLDNIEKQIKGKNTVEVILVDDGSKDQSGKICQKFSEKNNDINLFQQTNKGVAVARNIGLQKSHGSYICFIDSDDIVSEGYIDFILDTIKKLEFDILMLNHKGFYNSIADMTDIDQSSSTYMIDKLSAMKSIEDPNWGSYLWNKIIKRSLFNGIKFPKGRNYEDLAVIYQIFDKARSFYKSDRIYYFYRQNPSSIMHTYSAKNKYDLVTSEYELYNFFKKNYPEISEKSKQKLISCALICLHDKRLDKKNTENVIKYMKSLSFNEDKLYKLEWWSYNNSNLCFYLLGRLRKIKEKRYLKKIKHDEKK